MALSAFFVYFPLTDTDIFWHLAAGREMVLHKRWLFTDPFSFSLPSPQWIDLHWLFQLIVYGVHSIGAEKALIGFKLLTVAAITGILCCIYRSRRYIAVSAFTAALLFYETRYLICLRPVLITMLCMALYIFLFENIRLKENKKTLWLCIPLQILWTNSQGLYMIGLFIIGTYWVEEVIEFFRKKKPLPVFITMLFASASLACLINPYGLSGLTLPFTLLSRINPDPGNIYSLNIAENAPLFSLSGYDAVYRATVIAAAIAACALFILNRKGIRPAHVLLFLGFSLLAYSAERNVLLFVVIVIPVIAYNAAQCGIIDAVKALHKKIKRPLSTAIITAALSVVVWAVIQHAWVIAVYPPSRMLSPFRFPEKITEYLRHNPVEGRMFNDIRSGGYLIWNFYPDRQVFIDGRLILRSEHFFSEYLTLCENPELFPKVARRFNLTYAILPTAVFPLYHKLIRSLYESKDWRLQYTDGGSVLFVRNDVALNPPIDLSDQTRIDAILDSIHIQWENAPYVQKEAMGYFSEMLSYLGLIDPAEMVKIRMRQMSEK
jgi:hypothetical protein